MDAETARTLTTAGAVLFGAVVGGAASFFATVYQLRHTKQAEVDREVRADDRRKSDIRHARERDAALTCDRLVRQVKAAATIHSRTEGRSADLTGFEVEVRPLLEQLESESIFLAIPLQDRISEAALVLRSVDDLEQYLYGYSPVGWVVHIVYDDVHRVIAAWLGDDAPPERSDTMCDLILGAEEVQSWIEEMIELQEEERGTGGRQYQWRSRNAPRLAEIKARRARPPNGNLNHVHVVEDAVRNDTERDHV